MISDASIQVQIGYDMSQTFMEDLESILSKYEYTDYNDGQLDFTVVRDNDARGMPFKFTITQIDWDEADQDNLNKISNMSWLNEDLADLFDDQIEEAEDKLRDLKQEAESDLEQYVRETLAQVVSEYANDPTDGEYFTQFDAARSLGLNEAQAHAVAVYFKLKQEEDQFVPSAGGFYLASRGT